MCTDGRMAGGKDISDPAVDLDNENPSLVAFGNQLSPAPGTSSKALTGTFSGPLKPVPAHQDKQILLCGWLCGWLCEWLCGWLAGKTSRTWL